MSILGFAGLVRTVADRYGYDAALLAAQAQQESGGNPNAQSDAGALGLMQFMPGTWSDYGRGKSITDPEASLDAGVRYMKDLLAHFQNMGAASPVELALASYNWGQGRVDALIRYNQRSDWDFLRTAFFVDAKGNQVRMPAQTQNYVPAIMRFLAVYRATFGAAKVAIPSLALGIAGLLGFVLIKRIFA